MQRREFVAGVSSAALAWPFATWAQQMPVIGFLHGGTAKDRADHVAAFRRGLKEGGYVETKDVAIEYRWADGHYDRLAGLAGDLVKRKVALIATGSTPAVVAAKAATTTIPIVFLASADPVKLGLVVSLARPGGNVTGIANISSALEGKRIETLRDLVPGARKIAYLANPGFPSASTLVKDVQAAGRARKVEIEIVNATSETEINAAFAALAQRRANALLVMPDTLFISRRDQITALAAREAIPACYGFREFVVAGGLMSLGSDLIEGSRQQGLYAARVLKGAKPADMPVIQADKFNLVVNRTAAKKLGLSVSRDFLERVDEIVD
jgi:putative ABC transport system substrate-binding protein